MEVVRREPIAHRLAHLSKNCQLSIFEQGFGPGTEGDYPHIACLAIKAQCMNEVAINDCRDRLSALVFVDFKCQHKSAEPVGRLMPPDCCRSLNSASPPSGDPVPVPETASRSASHWGSIRMPAGCSTTRLPRLRRRYGSISLSHMPPAIAAGLGGAAAGSALGPKVSPFHFSYTQPARPRNEYE